MKKLPSTDRLDSILIRAIQQKPITREDIVFLLTLQQKEQLDAVFKTARELRRFYFKNRVFLYGFLYINTYCRNNCNFCYYRVSNTEPLRYRKQGTEVVEAALALEASGVHLIDLTMGEDPEFYRMGNRGFDAIIQLVQAVKQRVDLPIMVSPGVVPQHVIQAFAQAGVSWYACYQETHQPSLFKRLRPGQNYEERLETKRLAHQCGLLTEEGLLVGCGESHMDIANSFEIIRSLNVDQVRAMNFVPQDGTPMVGYPQPDSCRELLMIALLRLVFPDRLIPASLDVEGLDGLKRRLDAGANVVTSIVPPQKGLAGVAQSALDIDDARRTTECVYPILESCGLEAASQDEFEDWIDQRCTSINHLIQRI